MHHVRLLGNPVLNSGVVSGVVRFGDRDFWYSSPAGQQLSGEFDELAETSVHAFSSSEADAFEGDLHYLGEIYRISGVELELVDWDEELTIAKLSPSQQEELDRLKLHYAKADLKLPDYSFARMILLQEASNRSSQMLFVDFSSSLLRKAGEGGNLPLNDYQVDLLQAVAYAAWAQFKVEMGIE